ncbi:hypothetical protein AgCh_015115 [Apium graveolens]
MWGEQSGFSQRILIKTILKGGETVVGETVKIGGWVKKGRKGEAGKIAFLEVNDGSCLESIQLIVKSSLWSLPDLTPTGTSVYVEGQLVMPPETNKKQIIEVMVSRIIKVGTVDPAKYPLPKGRHTLEFLRNIPQFRYRTDTVTTLLNDAEKLEKELLNNTPPSPFISQLKARAPSEAEISASVSELKIAKQNLSMLGERSKLKPGIPIMDGKIDYSKDFFARQSFLTVSGQLHAETCVSALGSVYTFGPTFRAEHSHTSRHLAEFWMVEPEMAFATLEDDMRCAEAYVKFMCQWLLDNCLDDMKFMADKYDKAAIDRLRMVASKDFIRVSYTDAITILEEAAKEQKFVNEVKWGVDLASEHERYLTEVKYESPVIVHDYPKEIKAFYMKVNSDNRTVAAMDVLVPKVGELIGGSQREDCPKVLRERMLERGLSLESYEWYIDLRRYGTVEHSGFGLGFERMLLFATGLDNIRDVIPFPRYPGRADL